MAGVLDQLRVRYELKIFPIVGSPQQAAHAKEEKEEQEQEQEQEQEEECMHVVVHVFNDASFAKYESYRAANRQTPLPPLLRGQSWWLRFVTRDTRPPHHPHHSGGSAQRPTKLPKVCAASDAARARSSRSVSAAAALRSSAGVVGDALKHEMASTRDTAPSEGGYRKFSARADFAALRAQGPVEGSVCKFKLLSYMQRTFVFRNLGCPLAKGSSDFGGFSCAAFAFCRSVYLRTPAPLWRP
jgi:hypothetical protein